MTIEELKGVLLKVYDKQTVHKDWRNGWSKENPTYGQCVPTALLVQSLFGGEIYFLQAEKHYYNVINQKVVDLTKEQFDYQLNYAKGQRKQPSMWKAKTRKRYNILKRQVRNFLNEGLV